MTRYLLLRALQALAVLLVMSFVVYGLMGLMPGDPIDVMVAHTPNLTAEDAQRLREAYGLDRPWPERYLAWLGQLAQGELGYSRLHAQPVGTVIWPALLHTLVLLGGSLILALAIALPLGIAAALKPGSWFDSLANLFAFVTLSMPVFWLGIMLVVVFSVILGWLPASGTGALEDGSMASRLPYAILPIITLGFAGIGQYLRHMRASMIESLSQDYIRTARAKGAGTLRIVMRHALRNGMIPVVTILALDLGALVSGALITETIFAWPGMGKLIFDSVMGNDYNLALVGLLIATFMTLLGTLLADLVYTWLDPRIRTTESGAG